MRGVAATVTPDCSDTSSVDRQAIHSLHNTNVLAYIYYNYLLLYTREHLYLHMYLDNDRLSLYNLYLFDRLHLAILTLSYH